MNFFPLVPYAEVGSLKAIAHPDVGSLFGEVLRLDGAEDKAAKLLGFAEIKKLAGMGQGNHLAADFPKVAVKPFLELLERDVGGEAIVEAGEGQLKLGSELSQRKCRDACLLENVVGGLEDARQVVHKGARPIKDDVPNHARASYLRSLSEVRKRLT